MLLLIILEIFFQMLLKTWSTRIQVQLRQGGQEGELGAVELHEDHHGERRTW